MLLGKAVRRLHVVHSNVLRNCLSSSSLSDSQASSSADVLFEEQGNKRVITLNRPSAHNAFNHSMAHKVLAKMKEYGQDNRVKMLMMKGAGDRAFCAGGDVKELAATSAKDPSSPNAYGFLRTEYAVMYAIGTCSAPYVALADGICMGAGCALAVNGKYRVASERTIMAMPETKIGYYPDNGASHFLQQLPDNLGIYLGLTSQSVYGEDAYNCGLATHFVTHHDGSYSCMEEELLDMEDPTDEAVESLLDKYHAMCYKGVSSQITERQVLRESFRHHSVEEIMKSLNKYDSEWARKTLEALQTMSPTAMKFTLSQLQRSKCMSLMECLQMELRMGRWVLSQADSDFQRGIQALLVKKHNKPQWKPSSLADVNNEDIESYFRPFESEVREFCPSG